MPEIPGPGTPILVLIGERKPSVTNNATIVRRLNNGTVAVNIPAMGGEWEAEAIIVYRLLRRTNQIEPSNQMESQPSLGEESHVESIESATKPSASAESESKHQEDSPLKRKRRSARKL